MEQKRWYILKAEISVWMSIVAKLACSTTKDTSAKLKITVDVKMQQTVEIWFKTCYDIWIVLFTMIVISKEVLTYLEKIIIICEISKLVFIIAV